MAYDKDEYFVEADGSKNHDKQADGQWKLGQSPAAKECQFKPGNKLGGRPKGSKNKRTLQQELADKPGLSPAEFLYSVMNDHNANAGQRLSAAKELMGYVEPRLASIEVHTDEDHEAPFNIFLNTTPEAIDRIKEAEEMLEEELEHNQGEDEDDDDK